MNALNVSEMSKTYRVKKLTVADVDEILLCVRKIRSITNTARRSSQKSE